jgi:hypothetical protein
MRTFVLYTNKNINFNLGEKRKKLIKVAKTAAAAGSNESHQSAEQQMARETLCKALFTSNQKRLQNSPQTNASSRVVVGENNSGESSSVETAGNKQSSSQASTVQALLANVYSQINYNDLKKRKINQTRLQLWTHFIDAYLAKSLNPDAHVTNLCKRFKISL